MKKLLLLLVGLLAPVLVSAATFTANGIWNWNGLQRGLIHSNDLVNIASHGNGWTPTLFAAGEGITNVAVLSSIVAPYSNIPWPLRVQIQGVTYDGTTGITNWFRGDGGTNGTPPGQYCTTFNAGWTNHYSRTMGAGFIHLIVDSFTSSYASDFLQFSGMTWGVGLHWWGGAYLYLTSHSTFGGLTTTGGPIIPKYDHTMWAVLDMNPGISNLTLKLYDPAANYALIGTSTTLTDPGTNYSATMIFMTGYISHYSGAFYSGPWFVKGNPTDEDFVTICTPVIAGINVLAGTGGTVSGGGVCDIGSTTNILASASEGYTFSQWDDGNTNASRTVTVYSNRTYTATFAAAPVVPPVGTNVPGTIMRAGTAVFR